MCETCSKGGGEDKWGERAEVETEANGLMRMVGVGMDREWQTRNVKNGQGMANAEDEKRPVLRGDDKEDDRGTKRRRKATRRRIGPNVTGTWCRGRGRKAR